MAKRNKFVFKADVFDPSDFATWTTESVQDYLARQGRKSESFFLEFYGWSRADLKRAKRFVLGQLDRYGFPATKKDAMYRKAGYWPQRRQVQLDMVDQHMRLFCTRGNPKTPWFTWHIIEGSSARGSIDTRCVLQNFILTAFENRRVQISDDELRTSIRQAERHDGNSYQLEPFDYNTKRQLEPDSSDQSSKEVDTELEGDDSSSDLFVATTSRAQEPVQTIPHSLDLTDVATWSPTNIAEYVASEGAKPESFYRSFYGWSRLEFEQARLFVESQFDRNVHVDLHMQRREVQRAMLLERPQLFRNRHGASRPPWFTWNLNFGDPARVAIEPKCVGQCFISYVYHLRRNSIAPRTHDAHHHLEPVASWSDKRRSDRATEQRSRNRGEKRRRDPEEVFDRVIRRSMVRDVKPKLERESSESDDVLEDILSTRARTALNPLNASHPPNASNEAGMGYQANIAQTRISRSPPKETRLQLPDRTVSPDIDRNMRHEHNLDPDKQTEVERYQRLSMASNQSGLILPKEAAISNMNEDNQATQTILPDAIGFQSKLPDLFIYIVRVSKHGDDAIMLDRKKYFPFSRVMPQPMGNVDWSYFMNRAARNNVVDPLYWFNTDVMTEHRILPYYIEDEHQLQAALCRLYKEALVNPPATGIQIFTANDSTLLGMIPKSEAIRTRGFLPLTPLQLPKSDEVIVKIEPGREEQVQMEEHQRQRLMEEERRREEEQRRREEEQRRREEELRKQEQRRLEEEAAAAKKAWELKEAAARRGRR